MDWSSELVLHFLDLYKKEPVIWNPSHVLHKNRNDAYDAWKRIQENLGVKCSVTDMKRKKDSLMASYRACFNKVKQSIKIGAEPDEIYKPSWFAYEKMVSFLKDRDQPRDPTNSEDIASQLDNEIETNGGDGNDTGYAEDSSCDARLVFPYIVIKEELLPPISTDASNYEPPSKKIKKVSEFDPLIEKIDVANRPTSQQTKSQKHFKRKDDCDLYGELIARKLKKMDERTRDIAMNRIDNLLFEMKINLYQRQ